MKQHMRSSYILKISSAILALILTAGAVTLAANGSADSTVKVETEQETRKTSNQYTAVKSDTGLPKESADEWQLILVNPWNVVPEDYAVTLKKLGGGHSVDERCYEDLAEMMDECRAAGFSPVICSSYRTWEKQEQLYNNKVSRLVAEGYSRSRAETEAAKVVAVPGTSEHQLGLAVDIVDRYNQNLNSLQAKTKTQKWLMESSWKYGFILRYPEDKTDITGITYEPWHYRYVGREAAKYIYENGLCLEEYLELIS